MHAVPVVSHSNNVSFTRARRLRSHVPGYTFRRFNKHSKKPSGHLKPKMLPCNPDPKLSSLEEGATPLLKCKPSHLDLIRDNHCCGSWYLGKPWSLEKKPQLPRSNLFTSRYSYQTRPLINPSTLVDTSNYYRALRYDGLRWCFFSFSFSVFFLTLVCSYPGRPDLALSLLLPIYSSTFLTVLCFSFSGDGRAGCHSPGVLPQVI